MRVWPPRQTEPMAPVTLSKDPLAHISDREEVHTALVSGGQVGVSLGPAHVASRLAVEGGERDPPMSTKPSLAA